MLAAKGVETAGHPKNLGWRLNSSSVHPDESLVWVGWLVLVVVFCHGRGLGAWNFYSLLIVVWGRGGAF